MARLTDRGTVRQGRPESSCSQAQEQTDPEGLRTQRSRRAYSCGRGSHDEDGADQDDDQSKGSHVQ